jgi:hypothetical protein
VQGVFLPGSTGRPPADDGTSNAPTATGSTSGSPPARPGRPPTRSGERERGQAAPGFPPMRLN